MSDQNIQLNKMLLQATLIANLEVLKVYMPGVYEEFKDYQPEGAGVVIEDNGNINLMSNNELVYQEPPKEFSAKQVELYLKKPEFYRFNYDHRDDEELIFLHEKELKKLHNKRESEKDGKLRLITDEARIDMMVMVGAGLGYQIEELFKQRNIVNFILFEPSKDVFFAMLHCINLRLLIESCLSNKGVFNVRIEGSANGFINHLSQTMYQKGGFNISRLCLFKHYESKRSDEVWQSIQKSAYLLASGWGFMEDEIISLTHTISNIGERYPICLKPELITNELSEVPVFIVGNGPSLDDAITAIKANMNNCIVISCGTALKSLLHNDIKPDIHIEMERSAALVEFVEVIEQQQADKDIKLHDIQIVALNTVYTGLLKKFKSPKLINKNLDGGGQFINTLDNQNIYAKPRFVNPTVSNTALALCDLLGFRNVFFFGVDLGFKDTEKHHAKDSAYYTSKFVGSYEKILNDTISVPGNFGGEVFTSLHFDYSRQNLQTVLGNDSGFNAYNCSDGAAIEGAKPLHVEELPSFSEIKNKAEKLDELLSSSFSLKQITHNRIEKEININLELVKVSLEQLLKITAGEFTTREQLADAFSEQNEVLVTLAKNEKYSQVFWIIQGTFRYFQTAIMSHSYHFYDLEKRANFIMSALDQFEQHVIELFDDLIQNYNQAAKI